jgi:outer membrane lipoprotein-sorting protein
MKVFLLIFALACAAFGSPLNSLSADFTKLSQDSRGRDSVVGEIFYRSPSNIFLTIRFPVEQILYLKEKTMVVQYPKKKLAMNYTGNNAFSFPMFQALMGAMEGEGAISRSGFALVGLTRNGDTTVGEWTPRKGGRKDAPIASMKVTRSGGHLLAFAAYDRKGVLKKKVSYSDFQKTEGGDLPCRIRTEEFEDKASLVEEFALQGLKVNPAAPPSVENWNIPADFVVKEFHW